ncbi:MAG: hypothetical protein Kow0027_06350 [Saprospiraceae bacterium]
MAAGTVITDGHLVHVRVARDTTRLGFFEHQIVMAFTAIEIGVLPCQWKIGLIVTEAFLIPCFRRNDQLSRVPCR